MNSNREERLQMRQRGAASRKPKEVDFGFSFRLAPAIPEAPPQQPTTTAAPAPQPQTQPAPQAQLSSPKTDLPGSQGSQRTPGSARNARPQRPSTFDIPSDDDEIELPRSAKRRKIETPTKIGRLGAKSRLPRPQPVESQRNGDAAVAAVEKSDGIPDGVPGQDKREPSNEASVSAPIDVLQIQPEVNGGDKAQAAEAAPLQEVPEVQEPQEIQQPQELQSQEQPVQETAPKVPQAQPVETPEPPQELPQELQEPQEASQEQPQRTSPRQETRRKRDSQEQPDGVAEAAPETKPTQPPEEPTIQDEAPPQRTISPDQGAKGKRKRRKSPQEQAPAEAAELSTEKAEEPTPPKPKPETQDAGAQRTSPRQAEGKRRRRESEQAVEAASTKEPARLSELAEAQRTLPHQANTKRRRRVSQEKPSEDTTAAATKEVQGLEPDAAPKKRRGRPPASAREAQEQPQDVVEVATEKTQPAQSTEPEPEPEPDTQGAASKPPKRRGRPPAAQPSDKPGKDSDRRGSPEKPPEDVTAEVATGEVQAPEPDTQDAAPKKRRGRPPASREPQEQPAEAVAEEFQPIQPAEPDPDTQDAAPKKRRGRPSAVQPSDKGKEPEREVSDEVAPEAWGRRGRKRRESKATEEPSEEIEEPQPDDTGTRPIPKPGKRGRPAKRTVQVEQESPEPEEPQPDDTGTHPIPKPGKRGRPAKRIVQVERESQEPEEPEQEQEPEQELEQAEPSRPDDTQTTEQTERPARKKRAPRGETVPVTVRRLANITTLGRAPIYDSSESESDSSADELTQRTKHPTRGGVNQADVLNQICRETLEKTLTTLQTGITNEANPQRKAEWTRKKKAVEAFGTELEGRLFEMSEMLDSNFVLGVQLRRAKREMMDMRSRLYHVRQEREAIAVRTDSVRRRHAEEESGRMARTNINNSLHGLELAVERQRPDDEDEAPTSGLEYLVRAVGEEVSSRGDGGVLDRIKAFNAELERAARWLES